MNTMGCKFKRYIMPIAVFAMGILLSVNSVAHAVSLPGEAIVGDYELTITAMGKTYTYRYPEIDVVGGEVYLKNVEEVVEGIYFDTVIKPIDASLKIYPERENPFVYYSENSGAGIDCEKLVKDIKSALYARKRNISAEVVTLMPTVTLAALKEETKLLSTFSTDYSNSQEERKHNVGIATQTIGGYALKSGAEFSFNEVVGARTKERGYKSAKIIVGGEFTEGVGGGVCQVSSTLYNCALLAGLTVTERHNHSLLVSYVEPSFDAMVNSGSADLKILNSKDSNVYIVASCNGEKIKFRIYGRNDGFEYKRISVIDEYISPPAEEIVETADLELGERRVVCASKRGVKSSGYLVKYLNGKKISETRLSKDSYAAVKGKVEIGTKI